jgi:hypothetical protein
MFPSFLLSQFVDFCSFRLSYGLSLYTSCVLGLCHSALFNKLIIYQNMWLPIVALQGNCQKSINASNECVSSP